jgi:predicted flap endonuclease-1-like 5' DNA nuclease
MGFLLAKILGLLLVAAACGAWFSHWWFRRNYQDVTLEYTRWREEWETWRRAFEERLAARPAVDLQPLGQQIAAVDAAVRGIYIPKPPDLGPVLSAVAGIRMPTPERIDLEPLYDRLDAIEQRLAYIAAERLDLVSEQLTALRTKLESSASLSAAEPEASEMAELSEMAEADDAAAALGTVEMFDSPEVSIREGSRNLLSHPGHGRPDNLTRIKGVKRVMERTLHDAGVFYFWQIADWSEEDIEHMHDLLPEFKGRIERDEWVEQAGELASEPDAAVPPEALPKGH